MASINDYCDSHQESTLFKSPEHKFVNGQVVKISDVIVHTFNIGDVEDPDLYAGEPIYQWQQSESGKWIMEHAVETPFWYRVMNPMQWGHSYCIVARLKEPDELYWTLKWKQGQS